MDYIVTKSPKNKGIAILLTLIFGPIGLFYASIRAGIIMTILPLITVFIIFASTLMGQFFLTRAMFLLFASIIPYWIICFVWAIKAVNNYNKQIEINSINYQNKNNRNDSDKSFKNEFRSNNKFQEWSKNNPHKSINDFYKENRSEILNIENDKRYNYTKNSDTDIVTFIGWVIGLVILTSAVLMYDTIEQTFKLSNILKYFN